MAGTQVADTTRFSPAWAGNTVLATDCIPYRLSYPTSGTSRNRDSVREFKHKNPLNSELSKIGRRKASDVFVGRLGEE